MPRPTFYDGTGRTLLDVDEATAALVGATIDGVEFVEGETEDDDYAILRIGDVSLYASAPSVYASRLDVAFTDAALSGYFECALWSGLDETTGADNPPPLDDRFTVDDLADETRAQLARDLARFLRGLDRSDISEVARLDAGQVGHDLCLTRNGHGAGFWDRGLGELGERLSVHARAIGESTLYVGDDGKLYV